MSIDRDDLDAAAALAVLGLADSDDLALLAGAGPDGDAARRAMADTAAALAFTLPPITPPPFASIAARLPAATVTPLRRTALPWALTATTAIAAAALAILWLGARSDATTARTSAAIALAGARDACRRDLAAYDTRLATITSPRLQLATVRGAAGGTAKVFIDPDQRRWLVLAFELPPVPDKDYQLWFVPDGGAPISAGLLAPGPDGVLGATPAIPSGLGKVRPAISLEPRGGSRTPTEVKLVGDPI